MRILIRRVTLAGFVALVLAGTAVPASAHAFLVRSDPPNGSVLGTAPGRVELWFNEAVASEVSSARLVDADGRVIAGTTPATTDDPRALAVLLPDLGRGTYGVLWEALSEDDGHATSGVIVFSVGAAAASSISEGASTTTPRPLDMAIRWLGVCLLATVVGGLGVAMLVLGRVGRLGATRDRMSPAALGACTAAQRRLLAMVTVAALAAVVIGFAVAVVQARTLTTQGATTSGTLRHLLGSTRWGHLWIAREGALIALATVAFATRSRLRVPGERLPAALQLVAVGFVFVLAGAEALGSHAASLVSGRLAGVGADSLHILAGLLWIGALPALLLAWPRHVDPPTRSELLRAARGPFTRLAIGSVVAVAVTGLYGAGTEVGTLPELVTTPYGRLVLLKGGLLLVVGAIGLVNATRLHGVPRPWQGPSGRTLAGRPAVARRIIAIEAVAGSLLLLVATVLADTPPPRVPISAPPPAGTASVYGTIDDLVLSTTVTPNRPGTVGFSVVAASSRRPPPAPIDALTLRVDGGAPIPLAEVEPGTYYGTATLPHAGLARLTTTVVRAGRRSSVGRSWSVQPVPTVPAIERGGPPLRPYVHATAVALLVAVAVATLVWSRRRRRAAERTRPTSDPRPADRIQETV